jgi:hypothetical protein
MHIAMVTALTLLLVLATVVIHYEILRIASVVMPRMSIPPRSRILVVIAAAFIGHVIQILLYACAYWGAQHVPGLGNLAGAMEGDPIDYVYYSAASFTTLGVGDIVAVGPLRLLSGIESLNGLILITWSASFTYIAMERFWTDNGRSPEERAIVRSRADAPSPAQPPAPRRRPGRPPHG